MRPVLAPPLTASAFAPFGDVIEHRDGPHKLINEGLCKRYSDLAQLSFVDGRAGVSLFSAELRALPHRVAMMERHPDGSQCFIPQGGSEYLTIVAPDDNGAPGTPQAFLATSAQSVNFHRNVWHGVLAPISGSGIFIVVDRIGDGPNLQEHWFDEPFVVTLPD